MGATRENGNGRDWYLMPAVAHQRTAARARSALCSNVMTDASRYGITMHSGEKTGAVHGPEVLKLLLCPQYTQPNNWRTFLSYIQSQEISFNCKIKSIIICVSKSQVFSVSVTKKKKSIVEALPISESCCLLVFAPVKCSVIQCLCIVFYIWQSVGHLMFLAHVQYMITAVKYREFTLYKLNKQCNEHTKWWLSALFYFVSNDINKHT